MQSNLGIHKNKLEFSTALEPFYGASLTTIMVKLNDDLAERRVGWIFMIIWFAVLIFYLTWDGWIAEWRICGYNGPNQHFDLNFFDMRYSVVDGKIIYESTNNLHNIIYLCYYTFFFAWLGLLTGNRFCKQGATALTAFPVVATLFTLNPADHVYIVQIVYDIVHGSSTAACIYLFYKNDLKIKEASPVIWGTWGIYLLSRVLIQPWPFWENNTLGYFGVNQINTMPFYFYGMEFLLVIGIAYLANVVIFTVNSRLKRKILKAFFPFVMYAGLFITFQLLGLVTLEVLDLGTCP